MSSGLSCGGAAAVNKNRICTYRISDCYVGTCAKRQEEYASHGTVFGSLAWHVHAGCSLYGRLHIRGQDMHAHLRILDRVHTGLCGYQLPQWPGMTLVWSTVCFDRGPCV